MRKIVAAILAALIASLAPCLATTVVPPTFDELVSRAEVILQGSVASVRSEWTGDGGNRRIISYVTFTSEDVIKGNAGATYTLRMLGGTVGDRTMEVTDAPKFVQGDRVILFVENNGTQFIPLVGIMHGCFRVQQDGTNLVLSNSGKGFSSVSSLGSATSTSTGEAAMTAETFKNAIREKLRNTAR